MVFHTNKKTLNVCGPQVRRLRDGHGWSQPEFAAKCQLVGWDVSRDIIARIEGGTRLVRDSEISILADVLGVSVEGLLPKKSQGKKR